VTADVHDHGTTYSLAALRCASAAGQNGYTGVGGDCHDFPDVIVAAWYGYPDGINLVN
jgi:hypothetical protein